MCSVRTKKTLPGDRPTRRMAIATGSSDRSSGVDHFGVGKDAPRAGSLGASAREAFGNRDCSSRRHTPRAGTRIAWLEGQVRRLETPRLLHCTDDLRIRLKDVITRLPGWPCIQKTCVAISDGPSRNARYEGVGRPLISSRKRSSSCVARRRTENGATRAVANSIATGSPSSFLQISATIGASASLSWKSPIFAVARSTKMLNGREAARLGGGEPGRCCCRARERRKAVHPLALGAQRFVVGCQVCTRQKCATRRGTSARPCRPPRPDARPRRSEGRARLPR